MSRTQDIDKAARKTVLSLQSLMAKVEYKYNRHEPCLVCNHKFMHHADGLPCESDDDKKEIIKGNRWK